MKSHNSIEQAIELDSRDPLADMRQQFHIPKQADGNDEIYLCGNSLGLQPKLASEYVNEELNKWQTLAVKGHFETAHPWMPYHEFLAAPMARIVGAKENEVVCMNSLTTNLHLMMVSFYRPNKQRYKILIENHAFPSDHYAVSSQLKFHGHNPEDALILADENNAHGLLSTASVIAQIEKHKNELALILLPGVQYYTGQVFDIEKITSHAKQYDICIGWDLAHAAGNIPLQLHQWHVDFAVWCTYKYLNSGPGSVGACFVHQQHHNKTSLPKLNGWWGHDKKTRFLMNNQFEASSGADAWQLSNPPILSLAAIRASLQIFDSAGGIIPLRNKAIQLQHYLRKLIKDEIGAGISIITPDEETQFGCQLSLCVNSNPDLAKKAFTHLECNGITGDWREPNVIRIAPTPLYNSFQDCFHFITQLKTYLDSHEQ